MEERELTAAREAAVAAVVAAWVNEGANPEYHRSFQRELRWRWPALAVAVERLAATPRR